MTINKAMNRIGWRFSTGKSFQPLQEDIDAYNRIAEFVNEKHKKQLIDNQLFGKLYIYLFGEFVNHYKTTVMDNIPQQELNKILGKDLRLIVEEVKDRLNFSEMENVLKETESLKDYKGMEYDEVADNLRIMVNGAINEFSPKKLNRV